jgi:hypothetical protein
LARSELAFDPAIRDDYKASVRSGFFVFLIRHAAPDQNPRSAIRRGLCADFGLRFFPGHSQRASAGYSGQQFNDGREILYVEIVSNEIGHNARDGKAFAQEEICAGARTAEN